MSATKERTWQTWAGARSDIVRAAHEAADALAGWSSYPSVVTWTVTYSDDVSETPPGGVDALADIYRADLPRIRSLWIEIRPDRDVYYAEQTQVREAYWAERAQLLQLWQEAADELVRRGESAGSPEQPEEPGEPEPLIQASVLLRFSSGGRGLRIEVNGPDRHQVSGLFDRLADILCRRQAFRHVVPAFVAIGSAYVFVPLLALGSWLPRALDLSSQNDKWEVAEIVGPVLALVIPILAGAGFWFLYPRLEIIDDSQRTRAERFAKFFWGMVGAVIAGIIAAAIWAIAS